MVFGDDGSATTLERCRDSRLTQHNGLRDFPEQEHVNPDGRRLHIDQPTMLSWGHGALRSLRPSLRPRPSPIDRSAVARLLSTLAILEQRGGNLQQSSLCAITAAARLGGSVTAFIAGSEVKKVADQAAKVTGVHKVIYVENEAYHKERHPWGPTAKRFLIVSGSPRELCSLDRAERPKGRLYACRWISFGFWEESDASSGGIARFTAGIRCDQHQKRRQYGSLPISRIVDRILIAA